MTPSEEITHLKAQLAEAHEAIRELNERASSHLRASQDTIQALKLELDKANAKLRFKQTLITNDAKVLAKIYAMPPTQSNEEAVRTILNQNQKKTETFHDCTGVPIGVGKITAPQITQCQTSPTTLKSEQPVSGKP